MKLLELRIQRFRSFIGQQCFKFPDGPGLYFLQGDNQVEPRLGSNGAGKSSVWDALTWVVYDKTIRGLRAGDVSNWNNTKNTVVELDYQGDDGGFYTLRRTWGPNTWTLYDHYEGITDDTWQAETDLTKSPDNPFLAQLRLELLPWLCCVVMGQGRPMFLDLDAGSKATLFSDVLGLNLWLDRSDKASKAAADEDRVIRTLEQQVQNVEGELRGLATTSVNYVKAAAQWQDEHDASLRDLETRYKTAMEARSFKADVAKEMWEDVESCRAKLAKLTEAESKADHDLRVFRTKWVDSMTAEVAGMKAFMRNQQDELDRLRGMDVCPTCKQPVADAYKHANEHRHKSNTAFVQQDLTKKEEALRKLKQREQLLADDLADYKIYKATERERLEAADRRARDADREVSYLDKDLDAMEREADKLEAATNPYTTMEEDANSRSARLDKELDLLTRRLDERRWRHSMLSQWVRSFKEIRLEQIAESLAHLEVEVNSCVTALGLVDWELQFAVDKPTKRGTVQKGFAVAVLSPHNASAVPWEAWSGGEAQRLRLAGNMGLGDLIRTRTGSTINLEVWDEPTQGMTPQGVADLLDALATRARVEGRQIWVVDHHSLGYGAWDGVATVIKDDNGSRIVSA